MSVHPIQPGVRVASSEAHQGVTPPHLDPASRSPSPAARAGSFWGVAGAVAFGLAAIAVGALLLVFVLAAFFAYLAIGAVWAWRVPLIGLGLAAVLGWAWGWL